MKIPEFVDMATDAANSITLRMIEERDLPYANLLRDGLQCFEKRWDAALAACVYASLTEDLDRAFEVAANASLITPAVFILDDVMDGSEEREGKPSLWRKYGRSEALIASCAYVNLFLESASGHPGMLRLAQESIYLLLQGEYRDITRNRNGILGEEEYWRLCYEKAGAITECGAKIACEVAGASSKERDALCKVSSTIGILSQVLDDMIDLDDDLRKGKTSLPVIMLGENSDPGLLESNGISRRILEKVLPMCEDSLDLMGRMRRNEYTSMLRDVMLIWRNFMEALLTHERCWDLCRRMRGIEEMFKLMFFEASPEMGKDEMGEIIGRY